YLASRVPLHYLRPRNWDDFWSGIATGTQALGTVKIPYVSADPWPAYALQLIGAELLVLAALMTFWPRASAEPERRTPLSPPERGARRPADRRRLAGGVARRQELAAARPGDRDDDRLLPVAGAAAAAARDRRRRARRHRAGRRAAACLRGRPRRGVVRLPRVR